MGDKDTGNTIEKIPVSLPMSWYKKTYEMS